MQHICHGADRMELNRYEHFRNQKETEQGVLYLYSDKKGVLLFCSEKPQKASYILMKALKETDEAFSSLWIPFDEKSFRADEISEYVGQVWNHFSQFQNEILESLLAQKNVKEIMDQMRPLLTTPFVLVGNDMLLLYDHPDLAKLMRAEIGDDYPEQIVENLLMTKEFHEAAKKREPFYYSIEDLGLWLYCINIVVDGYYYARLVVYAEKGSQRLSAGAEQLSEYLSRVIGQMIRQGTLQTAKSQDDTFHTLLQRLLEGYEPEAAELNRAMKEYQWEEGQTCQVFCLKPYMAEGWETRVENTMPTMIRKLEQTWRHSCAVFSGQKILWILNRTLTENAEDSYKLSQQLMVLLRENVFRAGASSNFTDLKLLSSAMKEAEAALETGTKKEPSYWFYRFDDYRLSFMLDRIRGKEIAPMLLVHPAIPILMQHDQTHENELAKTLEVLIEKQGNVTQAAEALFIHRTTLFRRLNQIKELTGIDLDDGDLMLELQLSFRILEG